MRNAIGAPFSLPTAKQSKYSGQFAELRSTLGSSATSENTDFNRWLK
jgi:hypothetical protein